MNRALFFQIKVSTLSFAMLLGLTAIAQARTDEPTRAEMMKYARAFYIDVDEDDPSRDGPVVWKSIEEHGWPDSLKPFQARFKPGRSYLTLYKKLPVWPMDMRTPNRFKNSMSSKEIFGKSSIGHMTVGWSCDAGGSRTEGLTGATGEDGQSDEMFRAGWGLTAFVSTFTDGFLQNGMEVQRYFSTELIDHVETDSEPPPMIPIVIEVPTRECERVRDFVKDYLHHPNKPYKKFGMLPDPLKFEGAGCGSFAISALSLSETWAPLTKTFWRTFAIPERLLGRLTPDQLPENVEPAAIAKSAHDVVSISRVGLVVKDWDSGTPAYQMHFVDPELPIFALRKWEEIAASGQRPSKYQRLHMGFLKRTLYFPAKSPDSTIGSMLQDDKDSGVQEINESFDQSFNGVAQAVRSTAKELASHGLKAQLVNFPLGVGVMVANPN